MSSEAAARSHLRRYLKDVHTAVLSTVSPDSRPYGTPITFLVDDRFRLSFITHADSRKVAQIRENPHVSICTLVDGIEQSSAQLRGIVTHITDATEKDIMPFVDLVWRTPPFMPNFLAIRGKGLVKVSIDLYEADMFYRRTLETQASQASLTLRPMKKMPRKTPRAS